jgi:hypothetical protein
VLRDDREGVNARRRSARVGYGALLLVALSLVARFNSTSSAIQVRLSSVGHMNLNAVNDFAQDGVEYLQTKISRFVRSKLKIVSLADRNNPLRGPDGALILRQIGVLSASRTCGQSRIGTCTISALLKHLDYFCTIRPRQAHFRMFSSRKANASGSQMFTPRWRKSRPSSTVWPMGG